MWKNVNGRLVQMTDDSRVRFKTYISREHLERLNELANTENTHVSYLIENGLKNVILDESFVFNKKSRLKDKVEFRTTCDEEILQSAKEFAKQHKLNFTDVVQASYDYINLSEVKGRGWRYRIE